MRTYLKSPQILLIVLGMIVLCAKYAWSVFAFPGVPFGYDAGIYRYLFLAHAQGFPPFILAPMAEWAQSHPLGLFFFSSIALKLGLPVDWLLGWIWNLVPVLLSLVFAWISSRRYGITVGVFLLFVSALSVVQEQGFLMMYWKVFTAFLFIILAFHFLEKRSWWSVPFGMLTIATHQQIGLLFALATLSFLILHCIRDGCRASRTDGVLIGVSFLLGGAWYLPNYQRALLDILPLLLRLEVIVGVCIALAIIASIIFLVRITESRSHRIAHIVFSIIIAVPVLFLLFVGTTPSVLDTLVKLAGQGTPGAFFSVHEYLSLSLPLLILGIAGLILSLRTERGSLWQFAVLWSGIAVISLFFFYRRFILPLDFFLLPFVALACTEAWDSRKTLLRYSVAVLLIIQTILTLRFLSEIDPHVTVSQLDAFRALHTEVHDGSTLVVLDNMAPWIVGFLPDTHVSGPGIFDSRPYAEWESFLLGTGQDRQEFFDFYPSGTFFYASDVFFSLYPEDVQSVLTHSCLEKTAQRGLYRSVCGK